MEEKLKHLEFIQGVISRMNSNSFSIKTWMVTILAAFIALFANNPNEWYLLAAVVPTLIFWSLDAYYLKMERQYRKIYNDAISDKVSPFNMDASGYKECYCEVLFSKTVCTLYMPIIVVIGIGWLYMHFCNC